MLIGPTLHYWYGALGTLVTAKGNTGALSGGGGEGGGAALS